MESDERRRSWSRTFGKIKASLKRHGSSSKDVPTLASHATSKTEVGTNDKPTAMPTEAPVETKPTVDDTNATAFATLQMEAPIVVDDGLPSEDDEPLLPVFTGRTSVDHDRARLLFEKYGLKYEARKRSTEEPPSKMRRVEKPVHIRTRWTCHACDGKISRDKLCADCGHRRCQECSRLPAKRVREVLEDAKQQKQQDDMHKAAAGPTQPVPKDSTETSSGGPVESSAAAPLVKDDHEDADDILIPTQYKYTMSIRPRNGDDLILRPKSQIIRRSCHKCETPFLPANKTECDNCQHVRCTLCPRYPAKSSKWPHGSPGDEQPSRADVQMYPAVQRVYKKPRQRVRYTCDQCQTLFADRDSCRSCGHARCKDCTRQP